jgi:hypothetical protein
MLNIIDTQNYNVASLNNATKIAEQLIVVYSSSLWCEEYTTKIAEQLIVVYSSSLWCEEYNMRIEHLVTPLSVK